jgi:origin recognition complex subunit 3
VYIYAPAYASDDASTRPAKRRKVAKVQTVVSGTGPAQVLKFEPLLNGLESSECVALRQQTFEHAWSRTDKQIQVRSVPKKLKIPVDCLIVHLE